MFYGVVIIGKPALLQFTCFIWQMQTERRVAANLQAKSTDLG